VSASSVIHARVLQLLDHTKLDDARSREDAIKVCREALKKRPAAVCVWPEYVSEAKRILAAGGAADVKVATVINFPEGNLSLDDVERSIVAAMDAGAQEIDVVFPFRDFDKNNPAAAAMFVDRCRIACGSAVLKIIIETAHLKDESAIRAAAKVCIDGSADFVKTSTGKYRDDTFDAAKLQAARWILEEIGRARRDRQVGLKVAGGVKTIADATQIIEVAEHVLGPEAVNASTLRIGASALMGSLYEAPTRDVDLWKVRDHAWSYFDFHARQRTQMFQFFILAAGLLGGAIGLRGSPVENYWLLALAGAFVSLGFLTLDRRNAEFVHKAEELLQYTEERLLGRLGPVPDRHGNARVPGVFWRDHEWDRWARKPEQAKVMYRIFKHKFAFRFVESVAFWGFSVTFLFGLAEHLSEQASLNACHWMLLALGFLVLSVAWCSVLALKLPTEPRYPAT